MKNYFSRGSLSVCVVSFIVLGFFSLAGAFDLPKIDTGIIDLLNKYNASVEKYDELKGVYNALKDGESLDTLNNVTNILDGDFSALEGYIVGLKDDANKVDEDEKSQLEKS